MIILLFHNCSQLQAKLTFRSELVKFITSS